MGFWFIAAIIFATGTAAASYYQQKKAQKQQAKMAQDLAAVQVSGHDNNRSLYTVYGKTMVGSTTVWKKVSDKRLNMTATGFTTLSQATGNNLNVSADTDSNRWLYRVVSLCSGPVDSITRVLIDNEPHTASRFNQKVDYHFATAISNGPTAGRYFTPASTYFSYQWDSSFKGQGVAYAFERFYLHKDAPAFQGEPQTKYEVKGRKVYDPRKDSTSAYYDSGLGVSTHRSNDSSTWQWTDNPAICLLDYLVNDEYGRGLDYSDIDLASIVSAADKCDVLVDIPPRYTNESGASITVYNPSTGTLEVVDIDEDLIQYRADQSGNTQKRFRLNVALDGSKEVLDNIQTILNVFKGYLIFANGKYSIHMDDVQTPVMNLNNDDIIGGLKITEGDRKQRINRATVKFINRNLEYKEDQVSWPEIGTSTYTTYLSEDQGEKLHKSFTLEGCTDFYQAEDTAEFLVRDSRASLSVKGTFGPRAMALTPGDVIRLTYDSAGYSLRLFKVRGVGINITNHEVNLDLIEYDESVYTWNDNKLNEPLVES